MNTNLKIKILRIKIATDNQEFDFREFFVNDTNVNHIMTQVVKEEDGLYWHAFITYTEPNSNHSFVSKPKEYLPKGLEDEVLKYAENNFPKNGRLYNSIYRSIQAIMSIEKIEDFARWTNITKAKVTENATAFAAVLEIINKYRQNSE